MSAYMVDKDHIDFMVQSALAGATDSRGWQHPGERFSYYSHERRIRVYVDPCIDEVIEERYSETIPASTLGQRLVDANLESIQGRYPDTIDEPEGTPGPCEQYWQMPYVFEPIDTGRQVYSIAAGLKIAVEPVANTATVAHQLGHYEYQACEFDGWHESDAFAFCQAVREHLLDKLPGAENASWGYSRAQRVES